jgi:hypothetical protein
MVPLQPELVQSQIIVHCQRGPESPKLYYLRVLHDSDFKKERKYLKEIQTCDHLFLLQYMCSYCVDFHAL